ncbi:hypothetical protein LXL04_008661 [Taraxacum kok-saghyz]
MTLLGGLGNCVLKLGVGYLLGDDSNSGLPEPGKEEARINDHSAEPDCHYKMTSGIEEDSNPRPQPRKNPVCASLPGRVSKNRTENRNRTNNRIYRYRKTAKNRNHKAMVRYGWWKTNSIKFPILSKLARHVLAMPISTVASESAFSTGGRVIDKYRSSLNLETAEALICAQNWIRSTKVDLELGCGMKNKV